MTLIKVEVQKGIFIEVGTLAEARALVGNKTSSVAKPVGPVGGAVAVADGPMTECGRCDRGTYRWSKTVGGRPMVAEGACFRCGGTGKVKARTNYTAAMAALGPAVHNPDQCDIQDIRDEALAEAADARMDRYIKNSYEREAQEQLNKGKTWDAFCQPMD